jgi:hypothetical protein
MSYSLNYRSRFWEKPTPNVALDRRLGNVVLGARSAVHDREGLRRVQCGKICRTHAFSDIPVVSGVGPLHDATLPKKVKRRCPVDLG